MKRLHLLVLALGVFVSGCAGSSTSPSSSLASTQPSVTAVLSPSNEVPPVSNAEASGLGSVIVTFNVTRDGSNNITAATATFNVTLSGFPAGTPINIAHIHQGAATCACPVVVSTTLTAGEVNLATGSGTFTKSGINVDPAVATAILANPAAFYFNVHSTLNPGGAARGQLAPR